MVHAANKMRFHTRIVSPLFQFFAGFSFRGLLFVLNLNSLCFVFVFLFFYFVLPVIGRVRSAGFCYECIFSRARGQLPAIFCVERIALLFKIYD